jgi:hypothetical protein
MTKGAAHPPFVYGVAGWVTSSRRMPSLGGDPSPEDRLIALACGVSERRDAAVAPAQRLAAQSRPEVLLHRLERHRLTALAGVRLEALDALPASLYDRVHQSVSENRLRTLVFDGVNAQVIGALEDAGVAALPLKGLSLAESIYEDPGLRRYADVDLLVERGQLSRATSILCTLGYAPVEAPDRGRLPELHVRMMARGRRLPPVEVHWRVHWFDRGFSAAMLAGSRLVDGRRRAHAADELAALLLFYARDGFLGLRAAADIAAWWDAHGAELDGAELRALQRRHSELTTVWGAAGAVLEPLVGLPAARLLGRPRLPRRARTAVRLTNWAETGSHDQVAANVTLVDLLLSPRRQFAVSARRHVFLRRDVLDDFYDLPPAARWRRRFWRAVHPPKMLARYALALWRVRRGRPWAPPSPTAGAAGLTGHAAARRLSGHRPGP